MMATGDKIYLADKETLDAVKVDTSDIKITSTSTKGAVDTVKSDVSALRTASSKANTDLETLKSDSTAIKNSLSNIQSSTANRYSDPYAAADMARISKTYYDSRPVSGNSLSTILQVAGSGILYMAVINNAPNYTTRLRVVIDNTPIVDSSFALSSTDYTYTGIFTAPCVIWNGTNNMVRLVGNLNMNLSSPVSIQPFTSNRSNNYYYSIRPIRFNSSLVIEGSCNGTSTSIYYYYELD